MQIDTSWFGSAKRLIIEATALISLFLAAAGLIMYEIRHLF